MRGFSFQIVTYIGLTAYMCDAYTRQRRRLFIRDKPIFSSEMSTSGLRPQGFSCKKKKKKVVIIKVLDAKTLAGNRQSWSSSDSDFGSRPDLNASSTVLARAGSNLIDRPKLVSCETVASLQQREHGSRGLLIVGSCYQATAIKTEDFMPAPVTVIRRVCRHVGMIYNYL
jgi:hypothetical protein